MKSRVGEPIVEILEAAVTDRGYRLVCRFSTHYSDPVAPGALYDKPGSADPVFLIHRTSKQDGLVFTFETFKMFDSGLSLPRRGHQLYYRGWWVRAAMKAALDTAAKWERKAYPDDGSHEHCLFSLEAISARDGQRVGYFSANHGWITERAYMDFIVRDIYRIREES